MWKTTKIEKVNPSIYRFTIEVDTTKVYDILMDGEYVQKCTTFTTSPIVMDFFGNETQPPIIELFESNSVEESLRSLSFSTVFQNFFVVSFYGVPNAVSYTINLLDKLGNFMTKLTTITDSGNTVYVFRSPKTFDDPFEGFVEIIPTDVNGVNGLSVKNRLQVTPYPKAPEITVEEDEGTFVFNLKPQSTNGVLLF